MMNSEDLGNLKSGHNGILSNGREEIAKVASSFKGAFQNVYPPPFAWPFLTGQGAGAHDPLSYLQADVSQYGDPTKRQKQNLDRTPRAKVNISIPVAIGVAVLAVAVLMVSIHLSGQIDVGR